MWSIIRFEKDWNTIWITIYEVEYITASDATKEAVWLKKFIYKFGMVFSVEGPVLLYCDSTGASLKPKNLSPIREPNIFYSLSPYPWDHRSRWHRANKDW